MGMPDVPCAPVTPRNHLAGWFQCDKPVQEQDAEQPMAKKAQPKRPFFVPSTPASCDKKPEAACVAPECVWCTSAAVPGGCYTPVSSHACYTPVSSHACTHGPCARRPYGLRTRQLSLHGPVCVSRAAAHLPPQQCGASENIPHARHARRQAASACHTLFCPLSPASLHARCVCVCVPRCRTRPRPYRRPSSSARMRHPPPSAR